MNEFLWQAFLEPLTTEWFQRALIGGALAAVVCGVIGCFVILRRMAFLGDALSHSMLAGVAAGYLIMQLAYGAEAHAGAMLLGALLAGVFTVVSVNIVSRAARIKEDAAIGIMYTGIFAAGGMLVSYFRDRIHLHLYDYMIGMLMSVQDSQLWTMAWVAAIVLAIVILCFRQLQISTFDPVMAASIGVPVVALNLLLTTCASLVVVCAVTVVGIILVVGLLVTPAATAYLLCDRLDRMLMAAAGFGLSSVVGGLYVSHWVGKFDAGPTIVMFSTLQFLVVWIIAPRYGLLADWLRRLRIVPQPVIEDVLGCIRRAGGKPVSQQLMIDRVQASGKQIQQAIASLMRQDYLVRQDGGYVLTEAGTREARRLLRAHRIWEAYLEHLGRPVAELHREAHRLEHVNDEAAIDYLDDKLGHPLVDPHGSQIPEDFVHLVPGAEVKAALLREGHRAVVVDISADASDLVRESPLTAGVHLVAGPRRDGDRLWTFSLEDGQEVVLDHTAADAVLVRLEGE